MVSQPSSCPLHEQFLCVFAISPSAQRQSRTDHSQMVFPLCGNVHDGPYAQILKMHGHRMSKCNDAVVACP